jgi:hypothetical protein
VLSQCVVFVRLFGIWKDRPVEATHPLSLQSLTECGEVDISILRCPQHSPLALLIVVVVPWMLATRDILVCPLLRFPGVDEVASLIDISVVMHPGIRIRNDDPVFRPESA